VRHHAFSATTLIDFTPSKMQQWAGLVCYYDTRHWYFLNRQYDERLGPCIALYARRGPDPAYENLAQIPIPDETKIRLKVDCDSKVFRFFFALGDAKEWQDIGVPQEALVLTDEYVELHDPIKSFGFTGAHVGLYSYDITGAAIPPAFDWFEYRSADFN
jgi:xylan 1,4-beta-xylosidase